MSRAGPCVVTVLGAALAAAGSAQSTHVVGPGGFAQIDPAIRAAAPGDTIRITASGRYDPFALDRGVTIRADVGVAAFVANPLSGGVPRDTTIAVPAGQTAELVDLRFRPDLRVLAYRSGSVRVTGGAVVFRDCWFEGPSNGCGQGWPVLEVDGAAVALQLCRLRGYDRGGVALVARRSTISAFDSTFVGGDGCWDGLSPGGTDAIRLDATAMHASRVIVRGGSSPLFNSNFDGGHGIVVGTGSRLWLAHALVQGGSGGIAAGRGGDGLHVVASAPAVVSRVTLGGGTGPPAGAPSSGPVVVDPALLVAWSEPVGPTLGATWTARVQTAPGGVVTVLAASRPEAAATGWTAQPAWLAPAAFAWTTQVADAQGDATVPIRVPNVVALRGAGLWVQAVALTSVPLQLTPLLGGRIR